MSSPNPGISAAGEAAGRTALNPSTGPAAIGGMVVPGEAEPDPPVPQRVPSAEEDRLTTVVSDIAKLATAMSALSLSRHPRGGRHVREKMLGSFRPAVHDGGWRSRVRPCSGVGPCGTVHPWWKHDEAHPWVRGHRRRHDEQIGGYANGPAASTDPPPAGRQPLSRLTAKTVGQRLERRRVRSSGWCRFFRR